MFSSIPVVRTALSALLFIGFARTQSAYESIYTLDAFKAQQTCVQRCFFRGYAALDCYTDVLGSQLGCPNTPCSTAFAAQDGCYCRGDLQPAAHGFLSTCIDSLCSVGDNSVNLAIAASIYSGYCSGRGLPAQNAAETSSDRGTTASTATSTRFDPSSASSVTSFDPTTPPRSTSSSNLIPSPNQTSAPSASMNKTSTIVVSVLCPVAGIAILLAVLYCWKTRRNEQRANTSLYDLPILPDDSASQMIPPATMGPSYPNYQDPSVIQSNIGRYGVPTSRPSRNGPW